MEHLDLKQLVVLHPLQAGEKEELDNLADSVKADLDSIIDKLEKEDSKRRLYTLSRSQSKDSVPYPTLSPNRMKMHTSLSQ